MGRTILCQYCKSTFDESILAQKPEPDICPVCGKSLLGQGDSPSVAVKEKTKWYYYKDSTETLTTTLYEDEIPLYTFEAIDAEDAKRQLTKIVSNSLLVNDSAPNKVRCPYCQSEQVQIVPKKFSRK